MVIHSSLTCRLVALIFVNICIGVIYMSVIRETTHDFLCTATNLLFLVFLATDIQLRKFHYMTLQKMNLH